MRKISFGNLPVRFPIFQSAVIYLLLDKFQPKDFVYGIVWTIVAIFWLYSIITLFTDEGMDIIAEIEAIKSRLNM